MALLEADAVGVSLGGHTPISGLSLALEERAALAILGRAGSGKSVLARALTGLLPEGAAIEGTLKLPQRTSYLGPSADSAALERALARGTDLLVGDEPGRDLPAEAQRTLLATMLAANLERGIGLVIFSRDARLPLAMGLDTAVLSGGQIVERGPARALTERAADAATRELFGADRQRTRTMMRPPIGEPLLELSGVTKRFADPASRPWARLPAVAALDAISFSVRRGEAVGLLGAAGAGKSLLLRLVAGLGRPSAGKVAFERTDRRGHDLPRERRPAIGFVFPDPHRAFNPDLPVGLTMTETMHVEEQLLLDEQADRLVEAVRAVGLAPDVLDRLPERFSAADLQRLALARALAGRPQLVLLDEPTAMLDPVERAEFLVLFNRIRSDYGLTVLCASREADVLKVVADRILVLERGHIVEGGKPGELLGGARHPATLALIAARYPEPPPPMPPAPEPEAPAQASEPSAVAPPTPEPSVEDAPDKGPETGEVQPAADGSGDGAGGIDPGSDEPAG